MVSLIKDYICAIFIFCLCNSFEPMDIQSEFVVDYLEWDSCFFSKKIGLVRNSLLFVEHISTLCHTHSP